MLNYDDYVALCQRVGAVAQGKNTNWIAHYQALAMMGLLNLGDPLHQTTALEAKVAERYSNYTTMCRNLGREAMSKDENWGEAYRMIEAEHSATYGDKPEAPLSYPEYIKLCSSVGHTPYGKDRIHWALHGLTIRKRIASGHLQPKVRDISDGVDNGNHMPDAFALTSPAQPQAPETASLSWPRYVRMAITTESIPPIAWAVQTDSDAEAWSNTTRTRLVHVATGLMSESIELEGFVDLANRYEELGDCYWYLAVAADAIGWQFDWVKAEALASTAHVQGHIGESSLLFELRHGAQKLQDHVVQKHIIYGRPMLRPTVGAHLDEVAYTLICLNALYDIKLSQLLEANIKKLSKRYPNGHFDSFLSAPENRDTQNELSHILDQSADVAQAEAQSVKK